MVYDHGTISSVKEAPETISISEFKATCLARLERVRRTGRRLLVTRRGEPVAEVIPHTRPAATEGWLGSAASSGRILGDLIGPVVQEDEWEAGR